MAEQQGQGLGDGLLADAGPAVDVDEGCGAGAHGAAEDVGWVVVVVVAAAIAGVARAAPLGGLLVVVVVAGQGIC